MPEQILAWHSDPDLKDEVVARMKHHRAQDEFIRGQYQKWAPETASKYRGCALGCTLPYIKQRDARSITFSKEVQKRYGISFLVADMIDNIFEGLPNVEAAADFAVAVIETIPVGADLSGIACGGCDCNCGQCTKECGTCFECTSTTSIWEDPEGYRDRLLVALAQAPVPG